MIPTPDPRETWGQSTTVETLDSETLAKPHKNTLNAPASPLLCFYS
jgi:hypothetical protein